MGKMIVYLGFAIVALVFFAFVKCSVSDTKEHFDNKENEKNKIQTFNVEQHKENCDKGNAESCIVYGDIKKSLKDTQESNASYEKAIKILKGECGVDSWFGSSRVENEDSCYKLAKIYNDGNIVTKDENKALEYAKKACNEKQHSESCGMKNAKSQQLAKENQEKCDNEKDASSCMWVAQYRESESDNETAKEFYQKARKIYEGKCDLGWVWDSISDDGESCYVLGQMYRDGQGIKQNKKQAKKYFKVACEKKEYQQACDESEKSN